MKKRALIVLSIILLAGGGFFLYRKHSSRPVQKRMRFIMDTYCTIQVPGGKEVVPAINKALDRMQEVDAKFNAQDEESPIAEFNQKAIPVSDKEIVNMVRAALQISDRSGGAFDITVGPLLKLWGFYTDTTRVPAEDEIETVLERLGYRYLEIKEGYLVKRKSGVQIDLGGIAKGYAIREAVRVLKNEGITSALIDAGGDIYAHGQVYGVPWRIGIRNPLGEGVLGVLDMSDLSVATSGSYERFFEQDGIRYHHLLDPKTGYPAGELIGVTVVCKDPMLADAWATALFVMGPEKGMELVETAGMAQVIMVTDEEELLCSSGLTRIFHEFP
ncbi:MAG: FAD:protein FMN transferase [bacterium]|jgi:thiamine biosynthesis lipoprotein|nr:FAD:protein FMN transferase [bacterium]